MYDEESEGLWKYIFFWSYKNVRMFSLKTPSSTLCLKYIIEIDHMSSLITSQCFRNIEQWMAVHNTAHTKGKYNVDHLNS